MQGYFIRFTFSIGMAFPLSLPLTAFMPSTHVFVTYIIYALNSLCQEDFSLLHLYCHLCTWTTTQSSKICRRENKQYLLATSFSLSSTTTFILLLPVWLIHTATPLCITCMALYYMTFFVTKPPCGLPP